jgi:hypothetical protein
MCWGIKVVFVINDQGSIMYLKVLGWACILIALLVLAPSVVPGAMSVLASFIVLLTLILSSTTIKIGELFYFKATAIISGINMFFVNDSLRFYGSLSQISWQYKLGFYAVFICICVLTIYHAKKRAGVIKH